ncbi:MAG TPA: glycosyltransferase [Vicinamibacteria bacterium]
MRLAFLGPVPPAATGIADYDADVLAMVARRHAVDVFVDQDPVERSRLPAGCAVHAQAGFPERHRLEKYDLAIHQLGNSLHHAFVYPHLARVPGLLVLHELVLHHSRARMLLASADGAGRYRAELAYSHPGQADRLAEAHFGTVGDLLPYAYPLFRLPVEASRATAVHNEFMAAAIRAEVPDAPVVRVRMPVSAAAVPADAVAALRARHGIAPDGFVVAAFGLLTREKRIETVARAVARAAAHLPAVRLLLVGPVPDPGELRALLHRLGVVSRTTVTGSVAFEELPAHIEAADLVAQFRYPTARETSAALLRVLAQGRPAVVSDLAHLAEIPQDAVVRADITDEEGELTRAILRLASAPRERERLSRAAAEYVRREHSPERSLASYEEAMAAAVAAPIPRARAWPAHWRER